MTAIKRIVVRGFRGIPEELELDFTKDKKPSSMAVYGTNGTGKSSLTDAWEWLHTGNVQHLAREGAGPDVFPHLNAGDDVSVHVEFADAALGTMTVKYDPADKREPIVEGNMEAFRARVLHPCQVRFEDLTRFVFMTKKQKHDRLADLLGFHRQAAYQSALEKVRRAHKKDLSAAKKALKARQSELAELLDIKSAGRAGAVEKAVNKRLKAAGLEKVETPAELAERLREVQRSEAQERAVSQVELERQKQRLTMELESPTEPVTTLVDALAQMRATESATVDALLTRLYEAGQKAIPHVDPGTCPLCEGDCDKDLAAILGGKLEALQEAQRQRQEVDAKRKTAVRAVQSTKSSAAQLQKHAEGHDDLVAAAAAVSELAAAIHDTIGDGAASGGEVPEKCVALDAAIEALNGARDAAIVALDAEIAGLDEAEEEDDGDQLSNVLDGWRAMEDARVRVERLSDRVDRFGLIVDNYVEQSLADIKTRFDAIAEDVATYFSKLERGTKVLSNPEVIIADRALHLKVELGDNEVSPAYGYLSESQLNSFGLAIFLASARHINRDFKFLILDDVINSFDAHKRPALIDLLHDEFDDFQLLVFTHDEIWRDELARRCKKWTHQAIYRPPGSSPRFRRSAAPFEVIEQAVAEDRPRDAGMRLGPYLEHQLQQICDSWRAAVPYRRRNDHTLAPLLSAARTRVKKKLGDDHPLTVALANFEDVSGFRNWFAHEKNHSGAHYTSVEIGEVVDRWKAVEAACRCADCGRYVVLDSAGKSFACECGNLTLSK